MLVAGMLLTVVLAACAIPGGGTGENDTAGTATPVALGFRVHADLADPNDEDWYSFTTTRAVDITCDGADGLQWEVRQPDTLVIDDGLCTGTETRVDLDEGFTGYVRVFSPGEPRGDYTLEIDVAT